MRIPMASTLLLCATLASTSPLAAQATQDPARWLSLDPGDAVRLTAPGVLIEHGTVLALDASILLVLDQDQEWTVSIPQIQSLDVQTRTPYRGTALGAVMGGLVGALWGSKFLETVRCQTVTPMGGAPTESCAREPLGAGTGALYGVAGGAIVGFLLGLQQKRWTRVYP